MGDERAGQWGEWLRHRWRSSSFNHVAHGVIENTNFKVLRFHFMARAGLLGKQSFDWSTYLTRCLDHQTEEMIEVTAVTWLMLFGLLAATLIGICAATHTASRSNSFCKAKLCIGWDSRSRGRRKEGKER